VPTDGHAIFRISSEGETLLHITDLAHNHVLMFENPGWFTDFDHNPEIAIATRKKVFAATRECIYRFHLPWPGLGVVIPNGRKGYQWVAESHRGISNRVAQPKVFCSYGDHMLALIAARSAIIGLS